MREIVHIQAGQCGNQIGAKVRTAFASPIAGHRPIFSRGRKYGGMFVCSTRGKVASLFLNRLAGPFPAVAVNELDRIFGSDCLPRRSIRRAGLGRAVGNFR